MTYKKPSMKIPVKDTFCARVVFRVQTIGIGRHRTIISVIRLLTPVPMEKVKVLMHFDVLMLFTWKSQKAFTGTH